MKYYARFNATDFVITELPTITDSSREVSFSDLEIDFRGKDEALLPIQYQEVKVIQIDSSAVEMELFTGYVDTVDYPEFTSDDTPFLITLSLLSPYAYASKRTINREINGVALATAITYILEPLISDGFTIETNELSTTKLLCIVLQMETVEKVMNYLANTFDFIWYIDKNKKIYLKDIDDSKNTTPVLTITDTNKCYLKSIKPYKTVVDYANQLNIKNIYLIKNFLKENFTIPANSYYEFEYPFSISKNVNSKISEVGLGEFGTPFYLRGTLNGVLTDVTISYNKNTNIMSYSNNIGFDGIDNDKLILLVKSDNDDTLIKGFKLNSDYDFIVPVYSVYSLAALNVSTIIVPYKTIYSDPVEAEYLKDKTNTSGTIEKVINGNGKYFIEDELFDYATSLFKKNGSVTNEIKATFKGRNNDTDFINIVNNLIITNLVEIELNNYKINGTFLITNVNKKYNKETTEIEISGRNFNLNENFNDIFRAKLEELPVEINESMTTFYCRDRKVVLSRNVYINGELVNE